jgi:chemotaxis protein CheC
LSPADDRLQEFASISAAHAANALAGVFERVVLMDPPTCRWVDLSEIASAVFEPEEWIAAVFVDLIGPEGGQAGILFERKVAAEVLRQMVGSEPGDRLDARQTSALAEIGNIALSAAASALGSLHDAVVLPSVPRVGYDMAGALLVDAVQPRIGRLPAYLMEAKLADREGALRARFVWIPES